MLFPDVTWTLPLKFMKCFLESSSISFFLPPWPAETLANLSESSSMPRASRKLYLIFLIMLPKLGSSECLFYDPIRRKLPGEPQIKSSILSALRSCTVKTYVIFCPSQQFLNLSDHGIFFSQWCSSTFQSTFWEQFPCCTVFPVLKFLFIHSHNQPVFIDHLLSVDKDKNNDSGSEPWEKLIKSSRGNKTVIMALQGRHWGRYWEDVIEA